jgi:hypothetical protein
MPICSIYTTTPDPKPPYRAKATRIATPAMIPAASSLIPEACAGLLDDEAADLVGVGEADVVGAVYIELPIELPILLTGEVVVAPPVVAGKPAVELEAAAD